MFALHLKPHKQTPGSGQSTLTAQGCGSRGRVPSEAQETLSELPHPQGRGLEVEQALGKKMGGAREGLAGSSSQHPLSSLEGLGTLLLCAGLLIPAIVPPRPTTHLKKKAETLSSGGSM